MSCGTNVGGTNVGGTNVCGKNVGGRKVTPPAWDQVQIFRMDSRSKQLYRDFISLLSSEV
jgi:hypothetical protein